MQTLPKRVLSLILGWALLLGLAACQAEQSAQEPPPAHTGITGDTILLGSSCALTGHASSLGRETIHGALSYLNFINQSGGVNGRRLKLISYDDAYDPPRCVANTQKLINQDQVFALFCYVGTPTAMKIIPMVEEARVPLVGAFTGANALRHPFRRYIINIRASYYQETGNAIRHLVEGLGIKRIAVFYQYDDYGFDGLTGTEMALQKYRLAPVAKGTYLRGSLDVEEALNKITVSKAEAVVMVGTYDPCAKFIKLARERDFNPVFYSVSFVGANQLFNRLGGAGERVIISQVVPPPWEKALLPAAEEYSRLLAQSYPEDQPNFVSFEGFINAKVLVEGLRRAGRHLNREKLITALESIHQFSLGIANPLSFSPENHQGLENVYFTRIENGRFNLLTNWERIRAELQVPGVTPGIIRVGVTSPLSGDAAFLGRQTIAGAQAYLNHINEKGGVHGRRIHLISLDDGGDPARCREDTAKLINEEQVFLLFNYVGGPATLAAAPLVAEHKVPLIGVMSGIAALRKPSQRYIFNIRASYAMEIDQAVRHLVEDLGHQRVAVFYQDDDPGRDGLKATERALTRYGLEPVAEGAFRQSTPTVDEAVQKIAAAQPEVVVLAASFEPVALFLRAFGQTDQHPLFYGISLVGADAMPERLDQTWDGVIVSQVVPPPLEKALLPAADEFSRLLGKYFPYDDPNFVNFEGFVNAKVMVEALRRAGRELNRARLIEVLQKMEEYSPGIGSNLTFGPRRRQGLDMVYFTRIEKGRLQLVTDWVR
ncbi:MAG: ABC transporter substrate-binding protein [Deltaproteobacteria bacterium]|nr:ABC transporter substrate-binding protein [Deltaproteobacteria bacterium]